jgi:hypothetical protein
MDSIPYDFDDFRPSFTFSYSIPSPVVSVVTMALTEALAHFTLRFPPSIYESFSPSILLYTFDFRFLSQFRTISTVSDPPLLPLYSISSTVISVVAMAVTGVLAHTSIYEPPLQFMVPSPIYEPLPHSIPLYIFGFRFSPLLRTISAVSTLLYIPPYSIPSPVISVVTIVVTEVPGTHFTLRFPLRFTVPFSDFRTSPYLLQDQ